MTEECPNCDGDGFGPSWQQHTCPRCHGRGKIEVTAPPVSPPERPADEGEQQMNTKTEALIAAAKQADWGQVVSNGGPPCFHLMDYGRLCLRAERWPGHPADHPFVSIADLLSAQVTESKAVQVGGSTATPALKELLEKIRALPDKWRREAVDASEAANREFFGEYGVLDAKKLAAWRNASSSEADELSALLDQADAPQKEHP